MADAINLFSLQEMALKYIEGMFDYYVYNPAKAPDPNRVPPAVLRLDDVQTNLQIEVVAGDIPIYNFRMYKNRNPDHAGMDICYSVVMPSETEASKSEALLMQKINMNLLLENFVVAKLDDKKKPQVTVVYQLQEATILSAISGGIYTGVIATAKIENIMYVTSSGKISTAYSTVTGKGD